jgi:hypothetical protein
MLIANSPYRTSWQLAVRRLRRLQLAETAEHRRLAVSANCQLPTAL